MDFYSSGQGDRLVDPERLPVKILELLREEEEVFSVLSAGFSKICEIGCMDGRYLEWAVRNKKMYTGIDPVARYIDAGRARINARGLDSGSFAFVHGSADSLASLLTFNPAKELPILIFPFNSFGNMRDHKRVLREIKKLGSTSLISSYATDKDATEARYDYYRSCGCRSVKIKRQRSGVIFSAEDGFESIAFHPEILCSMISQSGLRVRVQPFAEIGMAYTLED